MTVSRRDLILIATSPPPRAGRQALLRELIERCLVRGDLDAADQLLHRDYCIHAGDRTGSRRQWKQSVLALRAQMPGLAVRVEEMWEAGDRLVWRYVMENGAQRVHGIHLERFEDGKLIETWSCTTADWSAVI